MKNLLSTVLTAVCGFVIFAAALSAEEPAKSVRFQRTQLDAKFRSEGVAVAD
ncbi:MAG: VCBS repeat-containing protein, partial [Pirellulaceae bacterium]|nr:VCBS repeat-containing protein [Pirellulaceae bacterium]